MPRSSTPERPGEVRRGQLVWRLCRADLGAEVVVRIANMSRVEIGAGGSQRQSSAFFNAQRLTEAVRAAGPALLFGLRLWASGGLALYVAFWLALAEPQWARTAAPRVWQAPVRA